MTGHRILVIPGQDGLGRAILDLLGSRGVAGVQLPATPAGAIRIGRDGRVDPDALHGIGAVINCAGRTTGTETQLHEANVIWPSTLAQAAQAAGIARFVQAGSLSVYGRLERIERDSPIAPADAYGRSRAAGEQALLALAGDDFRTLSVRLPFAFDADDPALLGRLVSLIMRLRMLPVGKLNPCRRSMITYRTAAQTLVSLAQEPNLSAGAKAIADPEPLDLRTIAAAIRERLDRRIALVALPDVVVGATRTLAPSVFNRLFRSSVLAPSANLLREPVAHSVVGELHRYLDRLATPGSAGQQRGT